MRFAGLTKGWASFGSMPAMCAKPEEDANAPPSRIERKRGQQQGYNPERDVGHWPARASAGINDVGDGNERPGNQHWNGKHVRTPRLSTGLGCVERLFQKLAQDQEHPDEDGKRSESEVPHAMTPNVPGVAQSARGVAVREICRSPAGC